tara:strand:- start:590 stop:1474 length:885 start_codon:yes stop_codon:yes gene_type:complete
MLFLTGVFVKIISSIFYLFSGLLWKKIIPSNINYHIIYYRTLFSILFSILSIILFHLYDPKIVNIHHFFEVNFSFWLLTLSICFFSFYGLYYFTNALKHGRYSIVTPFVSSAAVFSFITALFIYNEDISISSLIAFFILISGLIYHQINHIKIFKFSKEIFFAILCSFFWGVSFSLYPIPIKKFGIFNFSLILELCVLLSCIYLLLLKEKKLFPYKIKISETKACFFIGACVAGGSICANFSLEAMPIYLNIIVSIIFEAIVLILGFKIFKEKLLIKDWVLISCVTICSVLTFF